MPILWSGTPSSSKCEALRRELRFVFRHFPLTQVHPHAQTAAETAEFAGAHGQFWRMHDGLFQSSGASAHLYFALAAALDLPRTNCAWH
jgi:protein-disulfide isomerase